MQMVTSVAPSRTAVLTAMPTASIQLARCGIGLAPRGCGSSDRPRGRAGRRWRSRRSGTSSWAAGGRPALVDDTQAAVRSSSMPAGRNACRTPRGRLRAVGSPPSSISASVWDEDDAVVAGSWYAAWSCCGVRPGSRAGVCLVTRSEASALALTNSTNRAPRPAMSRAPCSFRRHARTVGASTEGHRLGRLRP